MTSEIHSVRSATGQLSPGELIAALGKILGYQQALIENSGGSIDQFVGDCVLAYWRPAPENHSVARAVATAAQIIREKPHVPGLEFNVRINFAQDELTGAYFGPKSAQRFQVVGRARDQLSDLPRLGGPVDYAIISKETFEALPPQDRARFVAAGPQAYASLAN